MLYLLSLFRRLMWRLWQQTDPPKLPTSTQLAIALRSWQQLYPAGNRSTQLAIALPSWQSLYTVGNCFTHLAIALCSCQLHISQLENGLKNLRSESYVRLFYSIPPTQYVRIYRHVTINLIPVYMFLMPVTSMPWLCVPVPVWLLACHHF